MRNFILLIRKYWNIILFLILEIVCISLIAKSKNLQGLDIISSSNSVIGYWYKKQNEVVYYFQLRELNKELLKENAGLHNQLGIIETSDTFYEETAKIPVFAAIDTTKKVIDTPKDSSAIVIEKVGSPKIVNYAHYNYIPARVIKNSISNDQLNFITLNRGSKDGIKKDMAVVTHNGIVGRVAYVSDNYTTVVSVLSNRKISAKLQDGSLGLLEWTSGNSQYLSMTKIPITQKVKKGDKVYSSMYSFFPENIEIGKIAKVDTIKASNTQTLKIQLTTNFRNLKYVYVVADPNAAERLNLEKKSEKEGGIQKK